MSNLGDIPANTSMDKSAVGLNNVDNTSDSNKPISTAQQTALNLKVPTTTTVNGHALSSNVSVTQSDVGLGNADNTSDANKPVSTAQAASIATKQIAPVVQLVVPATGDTVSINAATNVFIVNPAAPLLTLFLAFPTGNYNGQQLTCIFVLAIVTVTVSGKALLTTLAGAGTGLIRTLTWSAALDKWC